MELKDRISRISEYFANMEITNIDGKQVIYVGVQFPKGWIIDDEINEKYKVSVIEGTDGNQYFACDIEDGIDNVFDAIDYNIAKMKDAIERARLLTEKTMQLKELFEDENNTVAALKTLRFEFDKQATDPEKEILIPNKKKSVKETEENNKNENSLTNE